MKAAHYLTSGLRGIVAAAFLSCAGPTLATRPYTAENRQENAYLDMKDILVTLCQDNQKKSDPRNFRISENGFHCQQDTVPQGHLVVTQISHYNWDEIERVQCVGRIVKITGKYDASEIWTSGPLWEDELPQCHDLEKAMRIYLEERKK